MSAREESTLARLRKLVHLARGSWLSRDLKEAEARKLHAEIRAEALSKAADELEAMDTYLTASDELRRMADEAGDAKPPTLDQLAEMIEAVGASRGDARFHAAELFAKYAPVPASEGGEAGKVTREGEITQPSADAGANFFQPGRTYTYALWAFRCDTVTTHPGTGERTALGWFRDSDGSWMASSSSEGEWAEGSWTEVTGDPEPEPCPDIHHGLTRPHTTAECRKQPCPECRFTAEDCTCGFGKKGDAR